MKYSEFIFDNSLNISGIDNPIAVFNKNNKKESFFVIFNFHDIECSLYFCLN